MMKRKNLYSIVIFALFAVAAMLHYTFWLGKNSVNTLNETKKLIADEDARIEQLKKRNDTLTAEINDLNTSDESMEERVRMELGHIRKGEVFYRIVETKEARQYSKIVVPEESSE